jgi:hypothetical protein
MKFACRACALCALFALFAASAAQSLPSSQKRAPLKETWPCYHSGDEIHDILGRLAGQCPGVDFDLSQRSELNTGSAAGQTVQLDVLHISRSGGEPKTRAMLIFGEHARELISPETALHFVQTLCGSGPQAARAQSVLANTSFTIVPNANPISRKEVEDGYYCKRTNEDGVDLNRNFGDAHRVAQGDEPGEEMNPGPNGFSEPESRIIKGLIDEERPEIYISVHSGAYLLGMPFGYTSDRTPDNQANMLDVLRPISQKYCEGLCPYGNLANLIHYQNPGCDIDYVAEQSGSPYVFTWEIYVGEQFRETYYEEARMQHGGQDASLVQERRATALQLRGRSSKEMRQQTSRAKARLHRHRLAKPEASQLVNSCIDQFNPPSEQETQAVVEKWTGAFLELSELVAAKKRAPQATPSSSVSFAVEAEAMLR